MIYTDILFVLIFVLLCLLSRALRPWPELREWTIIVVSLIVVVSWGMFSLVLLLAVAAINFAAAWAAPAAPGRRRAIVLAAIAFDLAALALFKYGSFIATNLGVAFDTKLRAPALGIPLAISFYTFHLISYHVDGLRRKIPPLPLRQYLFYLCFFPHLVAGPIVRTWQLPSQLGHVRRVGGDLLFGVHYFVLGFFLKAVVANNLAQAIDPYWLADAAGLSAADRWVIAFLYYCQIYSDFAGYSLMALGMARLLGYRLPANFRTPMLAGTMQEFWRRWHITLSRWLRDYLYISMGGNRLGKPRALVNILVTMLLGGLWHGAGWSFVAWGAMQGIGLAAERILGLHRKPDGLWRRLPWWLITQLWVTLAWVFFRAPDIHSALHFTDAMLRLDHASAFMVQSRLLFPLAIAGGAVLHHLSPLCIATLPRRRLGLFLGVTTGILLMLDLMVYSPNKVFIYFKF
ncbi:MAG TPA: MBOAT family O-acyltransferase [Stellaceae bacterium]|nr:MBOAT family O-acyltransferase [Stellaceae bacterium]